MDTKTLKDLDFQNKRTLMRVDFNVPLDGDKITDTTRIDAALPTIKYILEHGGRLILMSHLGRPKGEVKEEYSLKPCIPYLEKVLGQKIAFAKEAIGTSTEKLAQELSSGNALLLENLRFYKGEEHPDEDPSFTEKLASLGDLYVNDAFGTAHRRHASTCEIAKFFPGKCALGFLMEKEVKTLTTLLESPDRPFYAIIGGAKVGSKIGVLRSLADKVDHLFIGGGMAYTFLQTQGVAIGDSIFDSDNSDLARALLTSHGEKISLPKDVVITNGQEIKTIAIDESIPDGWEGMDAGPLTLAEWSDKLRDGKTIFWNGPVGVFENPNFAKGTETIAHTLADLDATTIAGGGDSVSAIQKTGLADQFTHISTGGGACLELIEFGHLPGLDQM